MERYRNFVRVEQMKENIRSGRTEAALELAEQLDPVKVRSSSDLSIMADLYLENGMLVKAKKCLTELCSRKKTRGGVIKLINLSIRLKVVDEAEKYYREFRDMAPDDFYNYIFRYNIDKLKGRPYDVLIDSLEKLKAVEYIDCWAYELAKLYHKAGNKEKCIAECNDIEIWFGDGEYVERAKALRAYYLGELDIREAALPARDEEPEEETSQEVKTTGENIESGAEAYDGDEAYTEQEYSEEDFADDIVLSEEVLNAINGVGNDDVREILPEIRIEDSEPASEDGQEELHADTRKINVNAVAFAADIVEISNFSASEAEEETVENDNDNHIPEQFPDENNEAEELVNGETAGISETAYEEPAEDIPTDYVPEETQAENLTEKADHVGLSQEESAQTDSLEEKTAQTEIRTTEAVTVKAPEIDEDEALILRLLKEEEEALASSVAQDEKEEAEAEAVRENEAPIGESETVSHSFKGLSGTVIVSGSLLEEFLKKNDAELKDYFGYFAYQSDVRSQLVRVLEILLSSQKKNICLVVTGEHNSGVKRIVKGMARVMQQNGYLNGSTVAFTDADKINAMKLTTKAERLKGCCLMISNAGHLRKEAVEDLLEANNVFAGKTAVVLTDYRSEINRLFRDYRDLNSMFPHRIHIPSFDKEDLEDLVFMRMEEQGYSISTQAYELLQKEIRTLLRDNREGVLSRADSYIEEIIDKIETRNAKSLLEGGKIGEDKLIRSEDITPVQL